MVGGRLGTSREEVCGSPKEKAAIIKRMEEE
jgi:hypothetical protein